MYPKRLYSTNAIDKIAEAIDDEFADWKGIEPLELPEDRILNIISYFTVEANHPAEIYRAIKLSQLKDYYVEYISLEELRKYPIKLNINYGITVLYKSTSVRSKEQIIKALMVE